jgi:hypothetical protein
MCNCASPSVRCNCPSYTSAVYSHSCISTVCSFTQYNLHIRSLANTVNGPPASALRKAVTTCIMPCLLYGAEAWFEGRTKNPLTNRSDQPPAVSTRIGWHLKALNQTLTIAARAILPAWKTYPGWALFRDAGLPSALIALEEAKLRFALHLQTVDKNHPLTARIKIPVLQRGRGAGGLQKPHSKVQRLGMILPTTPRHTLMAPHYSPGCRTDPTNGIAKAEAAKSFTKWWDCNDAGKTRDPNLAWSHSEAYGSAWENRNLGSIDTYRSCTKGLQKTAYLHLGDCNVKYTKAMKC